MSLRKTLQALLVLLPMSGLFAQAPMRVGLMASTIGPIESGILELLEAQFEQETGIRVRHVGAGTGMALDLARQGSVDLVLVHAKNLEEKFVAEGFGTERIPLMYNDFVIVGPASDPAGVRGMKLAGQALQRILEKRAPFVSRGDKSGTHMAELELWAKAGLKPSGPGYQVFERGAEGNTATLLHANAKAAYTIVDRASYLGIRGRLGLGVLDEGDEPLANTLYLTPVNPATFPRANHREAMAFVAWLTNAGKGQKLIANFGQETFGTPLFTPEAVASKPAIH